VNAEWMLFEAPTLLTVPLVKAGEFHQPTPVSLFPADAREK
jgi:hypothetical protein